MVALGLHQWTRTMWWYWRTMLWSPHMYNEMILCMYYATISCNILCTTIHTNKLYLLCSNHLLAVHHVQYNLYVVGQTKDWKRVIWYQLWDQKTLLTFRLNALPWWRLKHWVKISKNRYQRTLFSVNAGANWEATTSSKPGTDLHCGAKHKTIFMHSECLYNNKACLACALKQATGQDDSCTSCTGSGGGSTAQVHSGKHCCIVCMHLHHPQGHSK